jgi:hypothetical protein
MKKFLNLILNITILLLTTGYTMRKKTLLLATAILSLFLSTTNAQEVNLNYYLPDINYDKDVPTPESVLGFQIGDWHLSHDQQLMYMRAVAAASDRVELTEYGRTHEGRRLVYLTITSEKNHKKLEELKSEHRKLSDPAESESVDISKLPAIIYQGFSIHGNEPSGGNAAPMVAYYLSAGKSKEVERLLDDVIILLDPCYNPDGFNRFASWVNTHKNKNLTTDNQDIEYSEPWPRGRTNHYWFDLNRDWLLQQHPESQGRINTFHQWKPNVLTDHHEMGTNSTFFFMPGAPTRINPHTPKRNQELTAEIGNYHAAGLDEIGSLYYTGEDYDDFYIGKGSTYPDVNGCIGILFEQGSSRGHIQESSNGILTFAFTIRNQVTTALSSLKATKELRKDLLEFQRQFYLNAINQAQNDETKAYVFSAPGDLSRSNHLIEIMRRHNIEVYELSKDLSSQGKNFEKEQSFIVPLEQPQYRLIKAMFDTRTSFVDSLFYDISAWSMQYAFNLDFAKLNKRDFNNDLKGDPIQGLRVAQNIIDPEYSDYSYLMKWDDFYAPKALNYILNKGLRAKVATESFSTGRDNFDMGTIMIPVQNQENKTAEQVHQIIIEASRATGVAFFDQDSGLTPAGLDMGSRNFKALEKAKVMLVSGSGTSSYNVGSVWHLLDQRYDISVSMVNAERIGSANLDKYTTIILADGNYRTVNAQGVSKLKSWIAAGGTLLTISGGSNWAIQKGLSSARKKADPKKETGRISYDKLRRNNGGNVIGGAIVEQQADISHPLLFGYHKENLPVFSRGTFFMEPSKNPYATPLLLGDNGLKAGYINAKNQKQMANTAGIVVSGNGRGKVITMANNPTFRAFWYGTAKIVANAIFFAPVIDSGSVERVNGKK